MTLLLLILGITILILGAELLVRGASYLAMLFGISPLVVGLTIVGFGTSSPELAVSIKSAIMGESDIVVGNVVGSNILNILLIFGISSIIIPLTSNFNVVRFDIPFMIGISFVMLFFSLNGRVSRFEGLILFVGLLTYIIFSIFKGRDKEALFKDKIDVELVKKRKSYLEWIKNIFFVASGLLFLVLGSHLFVNGAIKLARQLGVSELIIALTVVALGTSLPELVTAVVGAFKKEMDIVVGNIIGSNIFNILGILGLSSIFSKDGITVLPSALNFDIPVMIAVAVISLPICFTGGKITRVEGAILLLYYLSYDLYLLLLSYHHDSTSKALFVVIMYIGVPLTLVIYSLIIALKNKKS